MKLSTPERIADGLRVKVWALVREAEEPEFKGSPQTGHFLAPWTPRVISSGVRGERNAEHDLLDLSNRLKTGCVLQAPSQPLPAARQWRNPAGSQFSLAHAASGAEVTYVTPRILGSICDSLDPINLGNNLHFI